MKKYNQNILFTGILMLCTVSLFFGCLSFRRTIDGNGKIRAKEIQIGDYDKISINNSFQYEYLSGADSSFLIIETDENLLPYIRFYVNDKTLYVDIRNPETGEFITDYSLNPSKCIIRTGSPHLLQLTQTGPSDFTVLNDLAGEKFELVKTGSGSFCLNKNTQLSSLKIDQSGSGVVFARGTCLAAQIDISRSGSGDVVFHNLIQGKKMQVTSTGSGSFLADWDINIDVLNFVQTGSGDVRLNGVISAEQFNLEQSGSGSIICNGFLGVSTFNINKVGSGTLSLKKGEVSQSHIHSSGSGTITGMGCTFIDLGCDLVGSTYVTATASKSLGYSISGSGRLTVRGNPEITSSAVTGTGSFILMDD